MIRFSFRGACVYLTCESKPLLGNHRGCATIMAHPGTPCWDTLLSLSVKIEILNTWKAIYSWLSFYAFLRCKCASLSFFRSHNTTPTSEPSVLHIKTEWTHPRLRIYKYSTASGAQTMKTDVSRTSNRYQKNCAWKYGATPCNASESSKSPSRTIYLLQVQPSLMARLCSILP